MIKFITCLGFTLMFLLMQILYRFTVPRFLRWDKLLGTEVHENIQLYKNKLDHQLDWASNVFNIFETKKKVDWGCKISLGNVSN